MKRLLAGLLVAVAVAHAAPAGAGPPRITVYAGDFAPYVSRGEPGPRGVMVDLLRAIAARAEVRFDIRIVPWSRAQHLVGNAGEKAMIIPLTRSEAREDTYDWVVPLLSDPLALVGRDPQIAGMDLADARDLFVAVQANSPNAMILLKEGFRNFQTVTQESSAARLLKLNRVDAWFARPMVARAEYAGVGGDPDTLVVGPARETPPMYLGAAKDTFPRDILNRIRDAFAVLRESGRHAEIIKGY
ncbi:substrate-binding periplasmic protein [Limimonas halophila]|uniref:substrate-binding periplasmic protein n=1 Tax=Limimonas halophila TaxID=1082479 RepID=UPI0015A4B2C8|nr:transporter substrate-binding domain-containing protein [Limimonas halophila]